MNSVGKLARRFGLKIHVDGARLFNAAIALGAEARELVAEADSVNICLSKGLAAPVGSVVSGSRGFISKARRVRKVLGGGMRQSGVLAAAGIVSLTEMVDRLEDDHKNARKLAEGLSDVNGLSVDPDVVKTNIVYFQVTHKGITSQMLTEKLGARGVRVLATGPDRLRAVTHYQVTSDDVDYALGVFSRVFK